MATNAGLSVTSPHSLCSLRAFHCNPAAHKLWLLIELLILLHSITAVQVCDASKVAHRITDGLTGINIFL
jgi:hypothetical protein